MSNFEETVKIDLLARVPGETTQDKVHRIVCYITNCNAYAAETRVATLPAVIRILETFSLEELQIFSEMTWAHYSTSEHWYTSIKNTVNDLIFLCGQGWPARDAETAGR